MVKRICDFGYVYHEPPYTAEEEEELTRRTSTVRAFTRPVARRPAPPAATPKTPQDPEAE